MARENDRNEGGRGNESLEAREYRDKDGNVHHHTKTYMEQHGKSGGSGGGSGGSEGGRGGGSEGGGGRSGGRGKD